MSRRSHWGRAQEAFSLLQVSTFAFYGLVYLPLFAVPLLAPKDRGLRPGRVVRLASASGLLMTLLFVLRSAFPIIGVKSRLGYSAKIVAVLAGANALGLLVYRAGRARASGTLLAG